MIDVTRDILGVDAGTLNAGQMAIRAVLTFAITVALVRLGSKRLFGKGTAFDIIVSIMIGSVMSRAITNASALVPTLVAGGVLVGLHWFIAYLSSRLDWFGPLVKGNPVELIRDGEVLEEGLRSAKLSERDLTQGLLEQGVRSDPGRIELARLERDGTISVIERPREPRVVEVQVREGVQTLRIEIG